MPRLTIRKEAISLFARIYWIFLYLFNFMCTACWLLKMPTEQNLQSEHHHVDTLFWISGYWSFRFMRGKRLPNKGKRERRVEGQPTLMIHQHHQQVTIHQPTSTNLATFYQLPRSSLLHFQFVGPTLYGYFIQLSDRHSPIFTSLFCWSSILAWFQQKDFTIWLRIGTRSPLSR